MTGGATTSTTAEGGGGGGGMTLPRAVLGPWDVRMPPIKRHMVQGHLVPTLKAGLFLQQKKRRISIEIHSPDIIHESQRSAWDPENDILEEKDRVYMKIFRYARNAKSPGGHHDDETSVDEDDGDDNGKSWHEHYKFSSDDVEIQKVHGKIVEIRLGAGNDVKIRDIRFENNDDAARFRAVWDRIQLAEKDRAKRLIVKYKSKQALDTSKELSSADIRSNPNSPRLDSPLGASDAIAEVDEDEQINLLIEIVSGTDLPIGDTTTSDAYVIVRMKNKEIHRTSVIHNTLNPIWTLDTGSLFLLQMTPEDFFSSTSGMTFIIKDYDAVGANEVLGTVKVSQEELLEGNGDRVGYDIILPVAESSKKQEATKKMDKTKSGLDIPDNSGKLFLRFKKATQDDIDFMESYKLKAKKFGVYANEVFLPIRPPNSKFLKRQEKKGPNKEILHRVRPGPDPDRPENETAFMTKEQINSQALKPSTHWIQAGSGDIGKLYFEVIGCDGLPNMDAATLNAKDKTDAFACIVYEDCIVNTDVISDSLSPRWMPWCHRAFAFNISHPSSDVLLGVFDFDPELGIGQLLSRATSDLHDPIGRIVIELSRFLPNTTYLVTYPLYFGELKEHREKARGTITLRIRLDFPDLRKALIRGLITPPPTVVSVDRKIDYQVAHYAVDGIVQEDAFSLDMLARYVDELYTYEAILEYITEAVNVILFWRPHFKVDALGQSLLIPLHSITAFVWGVLVTWNYNLFPSFLVFSIAWIMLATNEAMRQHPSRWYKCPAYHDLLKRLLLNVADSEIVRANDNIGAIEKYDKDAIERKNRMEEQRKRHEEQELALQARLGEDLAEAEKAEEVGHAKKGGILGSVNPLKPILYPVQQQLQSIIQMLRVAKSIILWNEAYYAFWIVTGCLAVSFVISWIPWCFVFRWLLRIGVFLGLGPWMALADRYYFKSKSEVDLTPEEREEAIKSRLRARYEEVLMSATNFQLRKERAVKMKAMKMYMFGKHLLRVPLFHEDLFFDNPLPASSARPVDPETDIPIRVMEVKFGQRLEGDMIPHREIQSRTVNAITNSEDSKIGMVPKLSSANAHEIEPLLSKKKSGYESLAEKTKTG